MDERYVVVDGQKIRRERRKQGMTQVGLQEATKRSDGYVLSVQTISRIEREGGRRIANTVQAIAEALKLPWQALIVADRASELLYELNDMTKSLFDEYGNDDKDPFCRELLDSMAEYRAMLGQFQQGKCVLEHVDTPSLAIQFAKEMRRSLLATAFWPDDPMPCSARNRYLEHQAQAAANGVQVKRLFILSPGMEADPAFQARAQQDLRCNFQVRYRHLNDWIGSKSVASPVDVGVWDERRVWLYPLRDAEGKREGYPVLYQNKEATAQYREAFQAQWNDSRSIAIGRA